MSESLREAVDLLRREVTQATLDAAKTDNISINAEALAFLSEAGVLCVNAPIGGLENLDFKAMFDGRPVLDDTPVMYWNLSGSRLDETRSSVPAGFYTVVAHEQRGAVTLRNSEGATIAEGDLSIGLSPQGPVRTSARIVDGGVDSFSIKKGKLKVCGWVSVEVGIATVKVSGCVTAK